MSAPRWALLALLVTLATGALVLRARAGQPRREAEQGGLRLRVERALWLHEPMDHGDVAPLPSSPGAPEPGQRRLSVELTVFNPRGAPQDFNLQELALTASPEGPVWRPTVQGPAVTRLGPLELLPVTVGFDVPPTSEALRLEWVRGGERATLLSTRRPPSPGAFPPRWPRRVEELPPGDAVAGSALFHGRVACVACHGNPAEPESRRIGPALDDFARVGATRVPGQSAAQYAYESLLNPSAFIAPDCVGSTPCAEPSTMPLYGDVLSPREMADLISYLVGLRAGG